MTGIAQPGNKCPCLRATRTAAARRIWAPLASDSRQRLDERLPTTKLLSRFWTEERFW